MQAACTTDQQNVLYAVSLHPAFGLPGLHTLHRKECCSPPVNLAEMLPACEYSANDLQLSDAGLHGSDAHNI